MYNAKEYVHVHVHVYFVVSMKRWTTISLLRTNTAIEMYIVHAVVYCSYIYVCWSSCTRANTEHAIYLQYKDNENVSYLLMLVDVYSILWENR